ncbi:MAG TPA: DUF6471 domain-containing protein [Beijerinckiaceae bacterium]
MLHVLPELRGFLPVRQHPPAANKISRGGFTAVFFVQVLTAIGARELRID